MIKKYNQFVKQKVNENIDEPSFEETEGSNMYDDSQEEEEEEAGDIYKKRLEELSDLLGSEVTDGKIIHNGEEIIFPSETEMFHVGKKKFKTADEAAKYILSDKVTTESKSYKNRYK